jgi:2-oxoglutarate ferredoxin oxidoreductase subunit alpha
MMEPVEFRPAKTDAEIEELGKQHHEWCVHRNVDGPGRHHNEINSLELDPAVLSEHVLKLDAKYKTIIANEVRVQEYNLNPDNEMVCVAFGTSARIVKEAVDVLNAQGRNIGLIRPITVWPFPFDSIKNALGAKVKNVNVYEMNLGQMKQDVDLAVQGKVPVNFCGKVGGLIFTPEEIIEDMKKYL